MFKGGKETGYSYFIAQEGSELAGYACISKHYETGVYWLSQIVVSGNFKRRGIAREMMKYIIKTLKNSRGKKIIGEVVYDNIPMRKLLAEFLFVPEGLFRKQMNGKDEIRYALFLK